MGKSSNLKRHIKRRHGTIENVVPNKNHQCSFCEKVFVNIIGWRNHMNFHLQKTVISSGDLNGKIQYETEIRRLKNEISVKFHQCKYCHKVLTTKEGLNRH